MSSCFLVLRRELALLVEQLPQQPTHMFTKQIFPKHFERLRRVMMGHENFDDMQARYVQVKASGDDMDDPKLYVDSKPGRPPK